MNTERLLERALGILVEQDPCLCWPEPELVRWPRASLDGPRWDGGR
jgi:hypothetical protein